MHGHANEEPMQQACHRSPSTHSPQVQRRHICYSLTCGWYTNQAQKKWKKDQIGHHARPSRRASTTAPLRTREDMCRTGAGAGRWQQDRTVGGATTSGRRTKQEGNSAPT